MLILVSIDISIWLTIRYGSKRGQQRKLVDAVIYTCALATMPVVAIDNITDTVDRQHRLIGESTCRLSRIDRDDDGNDAIAHDVDRCERIVTFQHCRVVKVAVADRVVRQAMSKQRWD